MNDNTSSIVKIVGLGVGAYLLYQYLQSSGVWAQWFGGNSFSNPQQLLAYCEANPNGSATYTGGATPATATCAEWIAANGGSAAPSAGTAGATTSTTASSTTSSTPSASVQPAAGSTFISRLQAAAAANPALGSDSANVSQWNFLVDQIWPSAPQISVSTPAGNNNINAATYVGYYLGQGFPDPSSAAGNAGVSGFGHGAYSDDPYSWKN